MIEKDMCVHVYICAYIGEREGGRGVGERERGERIEKGKED